MAATEKYSRTAIVLHWLIALLIIVNVGLALAWPYVADESVRPLIDNHKSIGITVLGLALLRLLWRFGHRPPAFPAGYAGWEKWSAHAVHWGLYLVMFMMPLSGWIMDSAWKDAATHPMYFWHMFEWPRIGFIMNLPPETKLKVHDIFGEMHELVAYLLYLLFFLHVAGALKHQFLDKEPEFQRMGIGR
ncbi:cytochrome b [Flavisphingomonas formosensis]|uniref:cytochrome b n=1 Tax=Flavisphingomonas formosensis TaxID=861534 RepID=UPI0012F990F7|nr:cytochrome b/b6 domain-containing protein [Sphingomonas formosensis]